MEYAGSVGGVTDKRRLKLSWNLGECKPLVLGAQTTADWASKTATALANKVAAGPDCLRIALEASADVHSQNPPWGHRRYSPPATSQDDIQGLTDNARHVIGCQ
jgi:hypothetical protein